MDVIVVRHPQLGPRSLVGTRTMRDTVNLALRELVARHRQIGVLDLGGKVHWEANLAESRRVRS